MKKEEYMHTTNHKIRLTKLNLNMRTLRSDAYMIHKFFCCFSVAVFYLMAGQMKAANLPDPYLPAFRLTTQKLVPATIPLYARKADFIFAKQKNPFDINTGII